MKLLLALLNAAKLGKILSSGGTMVLSVFAYALVFGWWYAAGFVALIFVHEMGHYLAARQRGLDVGVPMFIPFVGAWIQLKELPHNVETEAYVGLAGPVFGTLGAIVCYFLALYTDSNLLLALAYAGFFINLFNLIPLSPLDGGRITAIVSPKLWLVGAPVLVVVFLIYPSPILILVAILALPQLYSLWRHRNDEEQAYYEASLSERVGYGIWYLGLVVFLAVMTYETDRMLLGALGR